MTPPHLLVITHGDVQHLWPFTQGEISGRPESFLDRVFDSGSAARDGSSLSLTTDDYRERVCRGGYPEVVRLAPQDRAPWFDDYVRTTVQRDVVELSGIRRVWELHQLLRLFAARTAEELVMSHVIDASVLERQAVYDHRSWLETIHLVRVLPAWSRNVSARVKRRPKVLITDTGLAAFLLGKDMDALRDPVDQSAGQLVETFVATELIRQMGWMVTSARLFHWQDRDGGEVDLILESADGRIVAIEVKKAASVTSRSFRWLAVLRDRLDAAGGSFVHGMVLYTGRDVVPFGDRLTALPIATLWT